MRWRGTHLPHAGLGSSPYLISPHSLHMHAAAHKHARRGVRGDDPGGREHGQRRRGHRAAAGPARWGRGGFCITQLWQGSDACASPPLGCGFTACYRQQAAARATQPAALGSRRTLHPLRRRPHSLPARPHRGLPARRLRAPGRRQPRGQPQGAQAGRVAQGGAAAASWQLPRVRCAYDRGGALCMLGRGRTDMRAHRSSQRRTPRH